MAPRSVIAWILALFTIPVLAADINGFRVWTDPEKTRAVLDLDSRVDYQVFTLANPPRVVIDFPRSGLESALQLVEEHAGWIEAVNLPDGGALLRVVLPVDEEARSALLRRESRPGDYRRERA
jgi:hypothetical protein